MPKTLYLLDAMALVYRAHFAFIQRPIVTTKGVNTSALYGFTQTLLELREKGHATHVAVAFDTPVPTARHRLFPDYKAQREAMPEALSEALPHVRRMVQAFNLPVLAMDGFEADDVIGTLVKRAEADGFESFMVTPDKDFGQLVTPRTRVYRPGRGGGDPEIWGPEEVCQRWGIERPEQVIDVLGLMGDASDNIPGVPGIGEKTAMKLIAQFGSVEGLLARLGELKGKQRDNLEQFREQALLSKRLATIDCEVPVQVSWEALEMRDPDAEALRGLLVEFEFNAIGKRMFGDDFKAGRGFSGPAARDAEPAPRPAAAVTEGGEPVTGDNAASGDSENAVQKPAVQHKLLTLAEVPHAYRVARRLEDVRSVVAEAARRELVGLAVSWAGAEPRHGLLRGVAIALAPGEAVCVEVPANATTAQSVLEVLRPLLGEGPTVRVVHDWKPGLAALEAAGLSVGGRWFDTALAHALAEPDQRHSLEFVAESLLGRSPMKAGAGAAQAELGLGLDRPEDWAEEVMERADLALQLRPVLVPRLADKGQTRVFEEIEMPLVPVLVAMEREGIRIDTSVLAGLSESLRQAMSGEEEAIQRLAGVEFNVNSPKQLGEVLFERLRLVEKPRKTRTGQYATDEQTLQLLAEEHEIVRRLLEYRACSKLKSTYADALPSTVDPGTGRVHTSFQQLATATGRLNSQNPNLQNIPIRSGLGQEVRKAFVPRGEGWRLFSADYSQIELRIIAALGREQGLLEAFRTGADVHTATAARVFGVAAEAVTPDMRKQAKMVNYGIAYGISAFGLSQRLGIPRKDAAAVIEHYFAQFPGVRNFMTGTVEFCRAHGYAETVTGRRRYLPDIRSANGTVRAGAERNAINAPIQGTAADMIKVAMVRIHRELNQRGLKTRMLLQVHDELVFDLWEPEQAEVTALVEESMRTALKLEVPIEVESGVGRNWLEAH